nr:unnamed protein product [Callosobruchus chinensis]
MADIICGVVYRPPTQELVNFLDQLEDSFVKALGCSEHIFCLGDFNVDYAQAATYNYNQLEQFIENHELSQLITDFTRVTANSSTLIDVILTLSPSLVVSSGVVSCHFSDHEIIFSNLSIPKPQPLFKYIRNYKSIDAERFCNDLENENINEILYIQDVDKKTEYLSNAILSVLDVHAPYKLVRFTKKPAPWLTDNLRFIMHLRDAAKAKFNQTKSVESWEKYKKAKNFATQAVRNEKKAFFNHLCKCKDRKQIWKQLQNLNIRKTEQTGVIPDQLRDADSVNEYFINSVPNVSHDNKDFLQFLNNTVYNRVKENDFRFVLATEEDIFNIIRDSIKTDAVGVDGINISIIKICYPAIKGALINIVNSCILSGYYPRAWKTAVVKPIPKKSEIEDFKDLRPISLLPTFSKILEHILNNQIKSYIYRNCILPNHQSGFRSSHSCATALLKVTDDILEAIDTDESSILVMLDFSKAFDYVNHKILISRLKYYGLGEVPLRFFEEYLFNCKQKVETIRGVSNVMDVPSGVLQGSVLGPLLYLVYTFDLHSCVNNCNIQTYANDTQLIHFFNFCSINQASYKVNMDFVNISDYRKRHCLRINPSKLSALIFTPRRMCTDIKERISLNLDGAVIPIVDYLKNLGVTIDSNLKFDRHRTNTAKAAYTCLRLLYSSQHILNFKTRKKLVESLVLSKFNYSMVLYYPYLDCFMKYRMQKLQNNCCGFVFGLRKYDRVSSKIRNLGWLPLNL